MIVLRDNVLEIWYLVELNRILIYPWIYSEDPGQPDLMHWFVKMCYFFHKAFFKINNKLVHSRPNTDSLGLSTVSN